MLKHQNLVYVINKQLNKLHLLTNPRKNNSSNISHTHFFDHKNCTRNFKCQQQNLDTEKIH